MLPNLNLLHLVRGNGDLSQTIAPEIEGRPLKGEFLQTAQVVNTMVDQLSSFASEVTRVAREVGTEGKLGLAAARLDTRSLSSLPPTRKIMRSWKAMRSFTGGLGRGDGAGRLYLELVVVGTWLGGLHALEVLLSGLSKSNSLSMAVVQHRKFLTLDSGTTES